MNIRVCPKVPRLAEFTGPTSNGREGRKDARGRRAPTSKARGRRVGKRKGGGILCSCNFSL